MDFSKFKELVKEHQDNITYLYIYYILTIKESLPKNILNNESSMKMLILLIENTYLYGDEQYSLEFICEVAGMYIEEIFKDNLTAEELDNLCSETFLNC